MTTKPNSFLAFLSTLFIFAGLAAAGAGYGYYMFMQPGPLQESKFVMIERGMGVSSIAEKLEDENVISYALMMKVAARLKRSSLKAGEYEFPARVSMAQAMRMMENGEVFDRKITVREGLTSYEIIVLLNENEDLVPRHAKQLPPEGIFLPETYHYQKGEAVDEVMDRMAVQMAGVIAELCEVDAATISISEIYDGVYDTMPCVGLSETSPLKTVKDVLVMASIVEKETGKPEERHRVAGVFINRLKKGIALQTDPTVIYAITKGVHQNEGKGPLGRRLLKKDLEIDDPYNTYKFPGLPPGPIANAGRASIEAVLHPEEHDYIYFVADGTGGHIFAKTLAEHNNNVAKWRKIRRSQ